MDGMDGHHHDSDSSDNDEEESGEDSAGGSSRSKQRKQRVLNVRDLQVMHLISKQHQLNKLQQFCALSAPIGPHNQSGDYILVSDQCSERKRFKIYDFYRNTI